LGEGLIESYLKNKAVEKLKWMTNNIESVRAKVLKRKLFTMA
jgi:hypothetical protein